MNLTHSVFGVKHIIIIVICIVVIVGLFLLSKKLTLKQVCKALLYVGIVSEAIKVIYYITANEATHLGYLPKTDLPFHLCSIQIIFVFLLNISESEKLKRILYSFMMPSCLCGGIAAILLATTSSLNGMWILSVQYFGYHCALVVFALYLLCNCKEIKFNINDYKTCLKFLVLIAFIAIYINSWVWNENPDTNINFMYVVRPPMEGLPYLNTNNGWLVYIIHYAFLAIFVVSLCYIKSIIRAIKKTKVVEEENESTNLVN